MRFDRPIGIVLLLWPTWWALLIAGDGRPALKNVLIFTAGVIVMRAAGCVMNDIADRKFDPHVSRTKNRPLATGALSLRQALMTFGILMVVALLLVLMTNQLTVFLAFGGALLASSYPFFKRFTHLPQVVLGLAFGWGIPMSFSAENGFVANVAWALLAINVVWALIYDTQYAMIDREDDQSIGVKSTAILFGQKDLFALKLLMVMMLFMLVMVGWSLGLSWPWYLAVATSALLFGWQQWIIRKRDPQSCFRAFMQNNWIGAVLFLGLLLHYFMI